MSHSKKINRNSRNLLLYSIALMLFLCIGLTGCSDPIKEDVSLYDLEKCMMEADDTLPEMLSANSNASDAKDSFSYLSDLDYLKVEGYFLLYSAEGKADEIAVIRVKSEKDVFDAKESLTEHAKGRVSLYKTYDPSQTERAEKAQVFSEGHYAVLIICDHSNDVKKAFEDMVKK